MVSSRINFTHYRYYSIMFVNKIVIIYGSIARNIFKWFRNQSQAKPHSTSTIEKPMGISFQLPSTIVAVNKTPWYFPLRCVASISINLRRYAWKTLPHAPKDQKQGWNLFPPFILYATYESESLYLNSCRSLGRSN